MVIKQVLFMERSPCLRQLFLAAYDVRDDSRLRRALWPPNRQHFNHHKKWD